MWTGNNDSISDQTPRNYMFGESIFILDTITSFNCSHLIGDLTSFVLNETNRGKTVNVIINSPGGEVDTMKTIIGLMNLGKCYDIVFTTFVLGIAGSAASMIAINGDYRYISDISKHFVHFGTIYDVTQKRSEIQKIYTQNEEYAESMVELYLKCCKGKLSKDTLLKLESDERGYLNAKDCLKYGLCDFIIEGELEKKIEYDKEMVKFENSFNSSLLNKNDIKVKSKKSTKGGK